MTEDTPNAKQDAAVRLNPQKASIPPDPRLVAGIREMASEMASDESKLAFKNNAARRLLEQIKEPVRRQQKLQEQQIKAESAIVKTLADEREYIEVTKQHIEALNRISDMTEKHIEALKANTEALKRNSELKEKWLEEASEGEEWKGEIEEGDEKAEDDDA